jgi:hypothetical protein
VGRDSSVTMSLIARLPPSMSTRMSTPRAKVSVAPAHEAVLAFLSSQRHDNLFSLGPRIPGLGLFGYSIPCLPTQSQPRERLKPFPKPCHPCISRCGTLPLRRASHASRYYGVFDLASFLVQHVDTPKTIFGRRPNSRLAT